MVWFGLQKFVTSSIRWLLHFPLSPTRGFLICSPPFFARQVIINLSGGSIFSLKINSYFDWATIHEIFVRLEYDTKFFRAETEIQSYYQSIVHSGGTPLIVDLGANIGVASTYFNIKFPNAKVIGLEPSETNASLARANVVKLPDAQIFWAAASSEDGQVHLLDVGLGNNAFRTFGLGEPIGKIQSRSVPSLLAQYSSMPPFIIKIDIEGFESTLFEENTSWIDSFKVIAIEIHDWMLPGQAVSSNLLKALGGKNRDLVFRGENLFSIRND